MASSSQLILAGRVLVVLLLALAARAARTALPAAAGANQQQRWVETISWSPRAFIYHSFLTHAEADWIVKLAEAKVERSQVVDTTTGEWKLDTVRTSHSAGFERDEDAVVASIQARIADWTHLPPENAEPLQALRYENGQEYKAHWDVFIDPKHTNGTHQNRLATVVMYLSDVIEGGETTLPIGKPIDAARQAMVNPSACAAKGRMAVTPKKGDALLFWDLKADGVTVDRASLHASCPTLKGAKWVSTAWVHNMMYGAEYDPLKLAGECKDRGAPGDCAAAVASGRCDSEAATMLGMTGKCRRSCADCIDCAGNDILCLRSNMRSRRLSNLNTAATQPPSVASVGIAGTQAHLEL